MSDNPFIIAPERRNSSATIWLPVLERHGAPSPRTETVAYRHADFMRCMENGEPAKLVHDIMLAARAAADRIGYPCFIRNDLTSAKHSGPSAYCANSGDEVAAVIWRNAEDAEMKLWPVGPYPKALLVREWLDLRAGFTAFGGMRVAREVRLFSDAGSLLCWHAYWPEDEQVILRPSREDWLPILQEQNKISASEISNLAAIAAPITTDLGGAWSVDFAQDNGGKWWLIDMAVAESSWHPAHD